MARAQYRFDHFYLTRPLSALSHVFHLFSSNLSRSDGLAPSRNALPPLFTLLSFGSGFKVQGSRGGFAAFFRRWYSRIAAFPSRGRYPAGADRVTMA